MRLRRAVWEGFRAGSGRRRARSGPHNGEPEGDAASFPILHHAGECIRGPAERTPPLTPMPHSGACEGRSERYRGQARGLKEGERTTVASVVDIWNLFEKPNGLNEDCFGCFISTAGTHPVRPCECHTHSSPQPFRRADDLALDVINPF